MYSDDAQPANPAPASTSARAEGMTHHSTGDNVPAAGAEFARSAEQPGVGDKELVRGSRGRSPMGAREASPGLRSEAEQPSSLDEIKINRNTGVPENYARLGRGRWCGAWTIAGVGSDGRVVLHRVNCKTWGCTYCGPRKAKRYKRAIAAVAEREKLNRFLTLTLDPTKVHSEPVRYLRCVFNKFRTYLKRKYGYSVK